LSSSSSSSSSIPSTAPLPPDTNPNDQHSKFHAVAAIQGRGDPIPDGDDLCQDSKHARKGKTGNPHGGPLRRNEGKVPIEDLVQHQSEMRAYKETEVEKFRSNGSNGGSATANGGAAENSSPPNSPTRRGKEKKMGLQSREREEERGLTTNGAYQQQQASSSSSSFKRTSSSSSFAALNLAPEDLDGWKLNVTCNPWLNVNGDDALLNEQLFGFLDDGM